MKNNKTVLIIEDNKGFAYSLGVELKDAYKYNILIVENADEAQKILDNQRINLIILDYLLPLKNGLQYITEVRQKHHFLPILFISSFAPEEIEKQALKYNNVHFMRKEDAFQVALEANRILSKDLCPKLNNPENTKNDVIFQIAEYIRLNASQDLTVKKLSKYYCISNRKINNLFKNKTYENIKEYLNKCRIAKSQELLLKSHKTTVESISTIVGFLSKGTFHDWFKKIVKMTPEKYRNQYK